MNKICDMEYKFFKEAQMKKSDQLRHHDIVRLNKNLMVKEAKKIDYKVQVDEGGEEECEKIMRIENELNRSTELLDIPKESDDFEK